MNNKLGIGILGVILGLFILIFPLLSQYVLSIVGGVALLAFGVYSLALGAESWSNKLSFILHIIVGIFALIAGVLLLGNIIFFDLLVSFYLFIVGFMLLFVGTGGFFFRLDSLSRGAGLLMALLGVLTIILGYFALLSPIFVSIILGLSLIIDGIAVMLGVYDDLLKG